MVIGAPSNRVSPVIGAPVAMSDDPPVVDPDDTVIEWLPVVGRFIGAGPVDVVGYQIVIEQVDPNRVATINLPGGATSVTVPPEFLLPDTLYDFEVIVFETSGNATISDGEFMTGAR